MAACKKVLRLFWWSCVVCWWCWCCRSAAAGLALMPEARCQAARAWPEAFGAASAFIWDVLRLIILYIRKEKEYIRKRKGPETF